jgi:hypothetical protein
VPWLPVRGRQGYLFVSGHATQQLGPIRRSGNE